MKTFFRIITFPFWGLLVIIGAFIEWLPSDKTFKQSAIESWRLITRP